MAKLDAYIEAEKRGILPTEKLAILTEARKRGLIDGGQPPQDSSFAQRVGQAFDERQANEQRIADEAIAGKRTEAEALGEIALSSTGGKVGDVIGAALQPIVKPAIEAASPYIPQQVKDVASGISNLYGQIPERGRDIVSAGGNLLNLIPVAATEKAVIQSVPKIADVGAAGAKTVAKSTKSILEKSVEKVVPKTDEFLTSDEARKLAAPLFKEAEQLGGSLGPEVTNKFIEKARSIVPKTTSKVEGGGSIVDQYLNDLVNEKSGQPLSLESIKNMDEHLSDLITGEVKQNGKLTNKGRDLMEIQDQFREITNTAALEDTIGKTAEAFDSWRRGQSVWADSYKIRDIEDIFKRAELADNEAMSIKTQFRNLYMNPKKMNAYNQEQRALIKKGAERDLKVDALRVIGSRLISTGMGYAGGGLAGAAVAYPVGAAARGLAAKIQSVPGKKLLGSLSKKASETSSPLSGLVPKGKK